MKERDGSIDLLLERENPAVRYHALHDLLGKPLTDPEVKRTRHQIRNYAPVRKVLRMRNKDGYWPPKTTFYTPKWILSVWALMLLGEMGLPADEKVKGACEGFLDLHQWKTGSFVCPSRFDKYKGKNVWTGWESRVWDEPCLTGNMIRTLLVFGYEDDPRVRRAIDWMPSSNWRMAGGTAIPGRRSDMAVSCQPSNHYGPMRKFQGRNGRGR